MIPARIISISDKVMVEYQEIRRLDIPEDIVDSRMSFKTIAEVENVEKIKDKWFPYKFLELQEGLGYGMRFHPKTSLKLNKQVLIEPTSEGKCRIIKI